MPLHILNIILLLLLASASAKTPEGAVPIYYINMDDMPHRAMLMDKHLEELGFSGVARRVAGLTTITCNLIMVERMCKGHKGRMGFDEIAILCSHVSAIRMAVLDEAPHAKSSRYALILEDDVRMSFAINFAELVQQAPKDFGVLQLMTSHIDDFETLWEKFNNETLPVAGPVLPLGPGEANANTITPPANISKPNATVARPSAHLHHGAEDQEHAYNHRLWTFRDRESTVWSAQAYLIDKEAFRGFVDAAVRPDRTGRLGYKLISQQDFRRPNEKNNPYKPVIMSQCIFSDMFIYSVGQPAYILNTPLFNGAIVGHNSTYNLHQKHVAFHVRGFYEIHKAQALMAAHPKLRPSFASPPPRTSEAPIDWPKVLLDNPRPSWALED